VYPHELSLIRRHPEAKKKAWYSQNIVSGFKDTTKVGQFNYTPEHGFDFFLNGVFFYMNLRKKFDIRKVNLYKVEKLS
jgi:hypothetical protein